MTGSATRARRGRNKGGFRWAVYRGGGLVAEGEALSRAEAARGALGASQEHLDRESEAFGLLRSELRDEARRLYKWSLWGPRGGSVEYMTSLWFPREPQRHARRRS